MRKYDLGKLQCRDGNTTVKKRWDFKEKNHRANRGSQKSDPDPKRKGWEKPIKNPGFKTKHWSN